MSGKKPEPDTPVGPKTKTGNRLRAWYKSRIKKTKKAANASPPNSSTECRATIHIARNDGMRETLKITQTTPENVDKQIIRYAARAQPPVKDSDIKIEPPVVSALIVAEAPTVTQPEVTVTEAPIQSETPVQAQIDTFASPVDEKDADTEQSESEIDEGDSEDEKQSETVALISYDDSPIDLIEYFQRLDHPNAHIHHRAMTELRRLVNAEKEREKKAERKYNSSLKHLDDLFGYSDSYAYH